MKEAFWWETDQKLANLAHSEGVSEEEILRRALFLFEEMKKQEDVEAKE